MQQKTKEIIELRNEVCSLEQQITLQERYSSKDSLIFENLPWDGTQSLPDFITSFLGEYLNFQTNPGNFKACHVLGRGQLNYPPAVIVKFIYFHEKNEIYGRKKMLIGVKNWMNGKQIFIKERLPPKDKELQVYANEQNLVTRTQNCQVQLLVEKDGIRKNIDVNSRKTIDDSLPIAVKKKLKVFPVARNHGDERTPQTNESKWVKKVATCNTTEEKLMVVDKIIETCSPVAKRPDLRSSPSSLT